MAPVTAPLRARVAPTWYFRELKVQTDVVLHGRDVLHGREIATPITGLSGLLASPPPPEEVWTVGFHNEPATFMSYVVCFLSSCIADPPAKVEMDSTDPAEEDASVLSLLERPWVQLVDAPAQHTDRVRTDLGQESTGPEPGPSRSWQPVCMPYCESKVDLANEASADFHAWATMAAHQGRSTSRKRARTKGYLQVRLQKKPKKPKQGMDGKQARQIQEAAHRLVLWAFAGPPTDKTLLQLDCSKWVCRHTCNNPTCLQPWHLKWGTKAENNMDRKKEADYQGTFSP